MLRARHAKDALEVFSTIAVCVAAVVVVWSVLFRPTTLPEVPNPVEDVHGLWIDRARITNVLGAGSIAIVEFADFQCPFCARHVRETMPSIKKNFVDSGDVRYVVIHFPMEEIHPRALAASEAAECAGRQGRFWEMRERLFSDTSALMPPDFVRYAGESALPDLQQFERCLAGHDTLVKIRADRAEGRRLGVEGTPLFFIGTMRPDGGIDLLKRMRGLGGADVFGDQIKPLRTSMAARSTSRPS